MKSKAPLSLSSFTREAITIRRVIAVGSGSRPIILSIVLLAGIVAAGFYSASALSSNIVTTTPRKRPTVSAGAFKPIRSAQNSDSGAWTEIGRMSKARLGAAVSELPDGRILIAGGKSGQGFTRTAEIFDPRTGKTESIEGKMFIARAYHTATLLPNGKVLLVGGENSKGLIASAEIFNLLDKSFRLVKGKLTVSRSRHSATVLPGGSVLIAGGIGTSGVLDSTENFDVGTESFTQGASLIDKRAGHTAIMLPTGELLIAGGNNGKRDLDSTEIGDTNNLIFSPTPTALPRPRSNSAAGIADDGSIMFAGGSERGSPAETIQYFDPSSKAFKAARTVPASQIAGGSALVSGSRTIEFGGEGENGIPSDSIRALNFSAIHTDRKSYKSGDVIRITGSGWMPGEVVALSISESDSSESVETTTVTADGAGEFHDQPLTLQKHPAAVNLTLIAGGQTSRRTAKSVITTSAVGNNYRVAAGVTTGNWNLASTWEKDASGTGTYVAATDYPGQNAGTGAVLIQDGKTVTLNVTPANSVATLNVGAGGSGGTLSLGDGSTARTLTVSGDVTIATGSTLNSGVSSMSNCNLNIGGNLTDNGAIRLYAGTFSLGCFCFAFNSNSASITFNGSGTSTISGTDTGAQIHDLIINGTSNLTVSLGMNISVGLTLEVMAGTLDTTTHTCSNGTSATGSELGVSIGATIKAGLISSTTSNFPGSYNPNNILGKTIYYASGDATTTQIIAPVSGGYGDLVLTGTGTKNFSTSSTILAVNGNLTIDPGVTFTINAGLFSSPGSLSLSGTNNVNNGSMGNSAVNQGVPAVTLNTGAVLVNNSKIYSENPISGAGKLMQGATGYFEYRSNSPFAAVLDATTPGNTVVYAGTSSPTSTASVGQIKATTYDSLEIKSNTSGQGSPSLGGDVIVNTALTIDSGATLIGGFGSTASPGSQTLIVKGSFTNNGTFQSHDSTVGHTALQYSNTVNINGSSAQQITGNAITFYNLTIDNSSGVTIGATDTVSNTLTLTSGNITTAANTLIVAGTVSRSSGHVVGQLQKPVATGSNISTNFEVGTGTNYAPVGVTFGSVTTSDSLTASTTAGDHPNLATSDIIPSKSVNRYWTLTPGSNLAFNSYSATLNFTVADEDPGVNTSAFVVRKFAAGSWSSPPGGVTTASTSTTGSGFTSFGDFAVGQAPAGTITAASNQMTTYKVGSQMVLLSATVTSTVGAVNEGTVTFSIMDGQTLIGSAVTSTTVTSGSASVNYTLPAGTPVKSYSIAATYNPAVSTPLFTTSSDASHTLSVTVASTTTTASAQSTSYKVASQTVTLSATVNGGGGAVNEGTVTFQVKDGSTLVGTASSGNVSSGSVSVTYSLPAGLAPKAYSIVATYNPAASAPNFTGSSDSSQMLTVGTASTTTTAADATAPFNASSQNVNLSATITSAAGAVNEGTVTFQVKNGGTLIGTATTSSTVSGGVASVSYALPGNLSPMSYTIVATYNPASTNPNFSGSSDSTHSLNLGLAGTTTTASAQMTSYKVGTQTVTFSATVSSSAGTVNEGTVTFQVKDGSTLIGSAATPNVSSGSASVVYQLPAGLTVKTYTIVATYNPAASNPNFSGSSDSSHLLTITQAATTVMAAPQNTPYTIVSHSVTLTSTVTSPAGAVGEGTVSFQVKDGATNIGSATAGSVSAGNVSVAYTLPAGITAKQYSIVATYSGGTDFSANSDSSQALTVSPAVTATVLASSDNPSCNGSTTFTATVSASASAGVPGGSVTFKNGSSPLATVALNGSGVATFSVSGAPAGVYSVSAIFNGSTDYASGNSNVISQSISIAPAVASNPVNVTTCAGRQGVFNATASGTSPSVQWQLSTNGGLTYTNLAGATSTTLTFTASAAWSGYMVRAVFSNACGTVTTTAAKLTVYDYSVRDDNGRGTLLFNSVTGEYIFCGTAPRSGNGTVRVSGDTLTFASKDGTVQATITGTQGSAIVRSGSLTLSLNDKDIRNNNVCSCGS